MHCPICKFTNRDGVRFCEQCGTSLEVVCLNCGAANSAGSRFCGACGASLGADAAPTGADLARDAAAERRQLTIMFCDLVGSTALSAKLDPEDLRDVIRHYQTLVSAEIRRYDGSVAKFSGDGIMAYFGFPKAHEDDAERAVLAGLAIVDSLRGVRAPLGHEQVSGLSVRVGIATGEVVVGDLVGEGVSERWAVVGETPNLAARLQSIAEPDSVVIGPRTKRLARGGFHYVNLGLHELKGIPMPVEVWGVKGKKATASRFDAAHSRALTPMVGRDRELALIDACWQRASEGNGQVVLIRGEPGIGKSRITQFFRDSLKGRRHQCLQYQCSPYHANSALHPVIAHIEQAAKFSADDSDEQKCAKLDALFRFSDVERNTGLPLIGSLLSIPCGNLDPNSMAEPSRQREKTMSVLLSRLPALAGKAPLLCLVEDVHWIDPSTLDLLHKMVSVVDKLAVLLLVTCRPEFEARWPASDHVTEIRLERFTEQGVKEIVAGITSGKGLPADVMAQIVAKADGVPLFAEELTKTVLDSGRSGQDPGLACMMYSALVLWLRGRREHALAEYREALARARALGHAFTLAYTLHLAAILEQCIGNLPKLKERAGELEQLAADRNFAQLHASARVFLGFCASEQEGGAASLEAIAQGIFDYQKSSGLNVPYFKAMLGHACGRSGDLERGLATLDEAMALADATHVRWHGAELYRLKGELLSLRSNTPEHEVDALFSRAVAIAKEQGATALEKKARHSLTSWTRRQARLVSPGIV